MGANGLCVACGSLLTLWEDLVTRRGKVSKLMICCTNTACNKEGTISDSYLLETKSLNAKVVMGMQGIGRG